MSDLFKRIEESFNKQTIMHTLGATLDSVEKGKVSIRLPYKEGLSQQHGFIHAGAITTIVDSACGYAAISLLPENQDGLAVEFKINFCNPAVGDEFIATGEVKKAGRTLIIGTGEVHSITNGEEKLIAIMQSTMMAIDNKK